MNISIHNIKVSEIIGLEAYGALAIDLKIEIDKIISNISEPILLVIDFTDLNPLTYEFVEISLKDIVNYNREKNDLLILYRIDKYEFSELVTGIIDMLELQSKNYSQLNENELLAHHYSIVHEDENNSINYLGNLSEVEEYILNIIEEKGNTTHNEIDEYLKSNEKSNYCEEITKSVDRLFYLRFIFLHKESDDTPTQFYSIKHLQENASKSKRK
ncbi:hypothetical protein [Xanthomarina gelatinilytica]|uniref:hypothetical protein n=1 Tax=Xanthomarina gelatinilytica TaxID=1137281 RepID=UPI003AA7AF1E